MNTSKLKSYAPGARNAFIAAVTSQAARLGITASGNEPYKIEGDVLLVAGQAFPKAWAASRQSLAARIASHGFDATMDAIAYTWFNRFVAIRYMELHGYLDHGYRVLSHPDGESQPQILEHAADVDLPGLDQAKVMDFKLDGTKDEELYRLLVKAQCNALHKAMPFLFEKIGDETELLLPANLLHTDSLVAKLVSDVDEELWQDIEIIGWLYQFYISEKKDEVIGKVVKSEDIPAATQLFTPNWIVKYMVQNSLGAQWLATYPDSPLKAQMEYYIEPAEQTDEVNAQLAAITPSSLDPEELTLIDPACGSGHILVEAYDLFKAIYLERGYRQKDVPKLILEKNLFGLDIDARAAQLTAFGLIMKGRADDRQLLSRELRLNVVTMVDSVGFDAEALTNHLVKSKTLASDLVEIKDLFEHATTFGSLIQVPEHLAAKLPPMKQLSEGDSQDLFDSAALNRLGALIRQAFTLAGHYDVVVANPPYMGNRYQSPTLKEFLKRNYEGYDRDVFSAFIDRNVAFGKTASRLGFMTPFVWMFISSHEHLRRRLINNESITSLVQLEYSGFDGATVPICTFTLQKGHVEGQKGCYVRLSDFSGSENQGPKTLEAILNRNCGWFFEVGQDDFTQIPGAPVAYWASRALVHAFGARDSVGSTTDFTGSQNKTGENERFLRRFWEIDFQEFGERWVGYSKGGAFRRWYGNLEYVVNWSPEAQEFYGSNAGSNRLAERFRFREGITYSDITSGAYSARFLPEGCIYDMKGPTFHPTDVTMERILSVLNSPVGNYIFKILNPTLSLQARDVRSFPLLPIPQEQEVETVARVQRLVEISRSDWDTFETSWGFGANPLIGAECATVEQAFICHSEKAREWVNEVRTLESENACLFVETYGLGDVLPGDVPISEVSLGANPSFRYRTARITLEEQETRFCHDAMRELVSYAIGCMMGRYSLDMPGLVYAHRANENFDQDRYPTFVVDDDGIVPLSDTSWFADDACNQLIEFVAMVWNESGLEENLAFVAANLSPKKSEASRDTIRRYIAGSFFKDHLKTYKKRPIYWLFSSGKQKAFQGLVYLHRYNEGTLSRMRSEYVIPLQGKMAARIEKLVADIPVATSSAAAKRLEKEKKKLDKQQLELIAFDEKLRHFADKRIALDLDDGVKVNYGKFGDLLAEVKAIHGTKPEAI